MEHFENNTHTEIRVHEATDWFVSYDSWLYNIDYSLWLHQKDIAVLRGNIHTIRSALSTSTGAFLRNTNSQTVHAEMDDTLDRGSSLAETLDFVESSRSHGSLSEPADTSTGNLDEITAHVTERRCSTASRANAAGADTQASGAEDNAACTQGLESTILVTIAERTQPAKKGLVKQRVGLRRSPRRHRQT